MALVYPPFGSKAVPPLGLSILSAGLKQLGFDSRVFYWNLEVIADLGDGDLAERMYTYERLSRTGFFPQNEWIFVKEVFPDDRTLEGTDLHHLDELDERFGYGKHRWRSKFRVPPLLTRRPSELTLRMRERARRKLVHLQPPRGVHEIEYDRFSPYHQDPANFGLHLKPKSVYRLLYPFDDETISHLVYFFEREDTPKFPYVKRLKREVHRWHRVARRSVSQRPLLIWTPQGADILIDDRRPGFPRRRYRLQNYAV